MRATGAKAVTLALGLAIALYLGSAGYLYVFQRSYVFQPGGTLVAPALLGLADVGPVRIRMRDGVRLSAWYAPPAAGQPTLLYFHGNAGSLSDRADRFRQVRAAGFGLLAASYRGFPGSEGEPSEAALVADGLELFDWLAAREGPIVLHGESIGAAVAIQVAAQRPIRALVLEAPFTAALDIAQAAYPWLPARLLMSDPFLSRDHIGKVKAPLLIVHGAQDRLIPVAHGRRLYAIAPEPKRLAIIETAGHVDLWDHGLWAIESGFLAAAPPPRPSSPDVIRQSSP